MPLVRKESPEEVIVRISPSRNTIIVQERSPGGVLSYREIDPVEFYYALNGSCVGNEYISSGFLPEHCLHVSMNAAERRFVIWNPDLRADVIYRDTEYMDFPLPRLVFGLRVLADGRVADCSMGVVADEPPTEDTPMFFYPFSNVYDDERVCTGNNILPRYKKLSAMKNFPRYLLGLPDNDDMFYSAHNQKGLDHKALLEHLKDKDPAYYYDRLSLSEKIRAGMEVSELIKRLTGRNYPVFVDNMESVDDLANVRPTGQIIMAKCVSNAPLQVRPIKPIVFAEQRAA